MPPSTPTPVPSSVHASSAHARSALLAAVIASQAQEARNLASTAEPPEADLDDLVRDLSLSQNSNSQEVLAPGTESAQELYARLERATRQIRNSMIESAYCCFHLRVRAAWTEVGFESEDACRVFLGHSVRAWKSYMLLGERLQHLTLHEMQSITLASAQLLTRVSTKIWDEYAWVEEARLLPTTEFSALVDQRNHEVHPLSFQSPKAVIKLQVPMTERVILEERIEKLKTSRHLTTTAEVIQAALNALEREEWNGQNQMPPATSARGHVLAQQAEAATTETVEVNPGEGAFRPAGESDLS